MTRADPFRAGLARGWQVHGGGQPLPERLSCDVVVVGSGAGGGITAELLARAGLAVVIVEEGPLKTSTDFRQLERDAYPQLYQDGAARRTADQAITVLQGRCVGGSTTVGWTNAPRPPDATLRHWQQRHGLADFGPDGLAPWLDQVERRLGIAPWPAVPNENNALLQRGAAQLGLATQPTRRLVKDCWNLGSCGLGCPTNAKQSMLLTTLPVALDHGARLLVTTRAMRLERTGDRITALLCSAVQPDGTPGTPVRVSARHYVLAGGALNTPALLLRSDAPDPHQLLGQRSFLQPAVVSTAVFNQSVEPWAGAPQSVQCDHFTGTDPIDGPMGYALESVPLHPALLAALLTGYGLERSRAMKALPHTHALMAPLRDGFHAQAAGGRVRLGADGAPVLDYPLTAHVLDAARRALLTLAELQFAAGAREVQPAHALARAYRRWPDAQADIAALSMAPLLARFVSTQAVGGCALAADATQGVVRPDGRHWQIENLSVHDASLFPTSLGVGPQLAVCGIANRLASGLARQLGRDAVPLA